MAAILSPNEEFLAMQRSEHDLEIINLTNLQHNTLSVGKTKSILGFHWIS